jgi:hypothetical protein
MANVVATRIHITGSFTDLEGVLGRLKAAFIDHQDKLGPCRDVQRPVLEVNSMAPWTVPLDWIDQIVGPDVDVQVRGLELSNVWLQTWDRRDGRWTLKDCREGCFVDDEESEDEVVYVNDGELLSPLPEWVASPPRAKKSDRRN